MQSFEKAHRDRHPDLLATAWAREGLSADFAGVGDVTTRRGSSSDDRDL